MLLNAAVVLQVRGDVETSHKAAEHALTLPTDAASGKVRRLLAFDAAVAGDLTVAAKRLQERGDAESMEDEFWRFLTEAVMSASDHREPDRKRRFKQARHLHRKAIAAYPAFRREKLLARIHGRAVRAITRAVGGPGAWVWSVRWSLLR
jgi:hypothetical protein